MADRNDLDWVWQKLKGGAEVEVGWKQLSGDQEGEEIKAD